MIDDMANLAGKAREIGPLLEQQATAMRARRDITEPSAQALSEAGLFRIYQPSRWGGHQASPLAFFDVQSTVAEFCVSCAWIQGVLAVQSLLLARFEEQAQADVWQDDRTAVVCSGIQPSGRIEPVDGGYRLTGRWSFSSGSSLCKWAIVGAMTRPSADRPPEFMLVLVPQADYRVEDVWHVFGLQGTGSNDLIIEGAFVPAYRSIPAAPGIVNQIRTDVEPLYRLPWLPLFGLATAGLAIGAAKTALREFLAVSRQRVAGMSGQPAKENAQVLDVAGRLRMEIDATELFFRRNLGRMMDHAQDNVAMDPEEALLQRAQQMSAVRQIASIIEEATMLMGARGVRTDNRVTQIWLDLAAARMHVGNDPTGALNLLGSTMMTASSA